jgi:hypothetical protein
VTVSISVFTPCAALAWVCSHVPRSPPGIVAFLWVVEATRKPSVSRPLPVNAAAAHCPLFPPSLTQSAQLLLSGCFTSALSVLALRSF